VRRSGGCGAKGDAALRGNAAPRGMRHEGGWSAQGEAERWRREGEAKRWRREGRARGHRGGRCEPQPAAAAKEGPRLRLTEVRCSTRAQGRVAVSGVDRGRGRGKASLTIVHVDCRMVERARRAPKKSGSEAARRVTWRADRGDHMGAAKRRRRRERGYGPKGDTVRREGETA
jgi:hypothetical protein